MGEDVSIAISAHDNFTQAITTMRNADQAFNKDLSGLQSKLDKLNTTKVTLKMDTDKARTELKAAEKAFSKTGSAADKLKLQMADQNYEQANRNLRLVSQNARQAEKDMVNLTTARNKNENRAGSGRTSGGLASALGKAGAWQFLGQAGSEIAQTYMTSRLGDAGGTMFGSVLGGAGTGAAIGTAIGGPLGTAVGAVAGAAVGAAQGAAKNAEKKDEYFKSHVQEQYSAITTAQQNTLESGSAIAAQRETNQTSFTTLLGGADEAKNFLSQVQGMAATTPFEYDDLVTMAKSLKTYFNTDEILPLLTKVGDTGAALGMSTSDMSTIAQMLGRMQSSGKATLEYLQPLIERGIPVWDYLSKATGKSKESVQQMVTKGLLPGEKAAQAIADAMGDANQGAMELQAQTYSGLKSTLEDAQNELNNAMGEGFNETRKKGIKDQSDWLSGDSGSRMQDAYRQIGNFKASQENQKEKLNRDALNSVMYGHLAESYKGSKQADELQKLVNQYKTAQTTLSHLQGKGMGNSAAAQKASSDAGMALAAAQVLAENEYYNTDGAKIVEQGQLGLIGSIQSSGALSGAYETAGYTIGQQMTKGIQSALSNAHFAVSQPNVTVTGATSGSPTVGNVTGYTSAQLSRGGISARSHAYGLNFVPYDNYPALLHYGERVQTANEARQQRNGNEGVTVSGNTFIVRQDNDIPAIAKEIARQVVLAQTLHE